MKDEIKEINIPENVLVALGDLTNGAMNYYKATETVKVRHNTILDYITNLQEENEYSDYCNKKLREKITNLEYKITTLEDYKSRNEKARKHAEFLYKNEANIFYKGTYKKQLDILNGDENE